MQLLSSDGQLFELSDAAARQSVTLQGAEEVGDDAVPVRLERSGPRSAAAAALRVATMKNHIYGPGLHNHYLEP